MEGPPMLNRQNAVQINQETINIHGERRVVNTENGIRSVTINGVVYPIERDSNNNQFITIDGVVRYETVGGRRSRRKRSKRRRRSSLKRRS
jgi:hypothetical protein